MLKILTGEQYEIELNKSDTTIGSHEDLDRTVLKIIEQVRERGDEALIEYTAQFDKVELDNLLVSQEEFIEARALVSDEFIVAIKKAHENISAFH
ncbi:histidinol dehydrogenase, partial [Microvirga sp. 3-52]|nr:histidinol dehydrogenase [Microvirga sp. 3-52]